MGIFDFLKSNKNKLHTVKQGHIPENKNLIVKWLSIHKDLQDLIWVGDWIFKNYFNNDTKSGGNFQVGGLNISMIFTNTDEPSLIYTNLDVKEVEDIYWIERPWYFPTYSSLSPEQKFVYLNFLSNPYDPNINIGFVFILYYWLERYLLADNYKEAAHVIIKLRDIHNNSSFQYYSANSVILTSILYKRPTIALQFIESLDKSYELNFSDNLFLICYYSFDINLLPKDIMRMSKTFGFNNTNYIKKYPDIFLLSLTKIINNTFWTDYIHLKDYLTTHELTQIKQEEIGIFANISITNNTLPIPLFSESFKLKNAMHILIEKAHNEVKNILKEIRKTWKSYPIKK